MASSVHSSQKILGILTRRERWGLSWRGWLLVTSAGLAAAYFTFLNIHPYLAVTHRVNTNVLVVEGAIQPSPDQDRPSVRRNKAGFSTLFWRSFRQPNADSILVLAYASVLLPAGRITAGQLLPIATYR
jgi:hypothetical protein